MSSEEKRSVFGYHFHGSDEIKSLFRYDDKTNWGEIDDKIWQVVNGLIFGFTFDASKDDGEYNKTHSLSNGMCTIRMITKEDKIPGTQPGSVILDKGPEVEAAYRYCILDIPGVKQMILTIEKDMKLAIPLYRSKYDIVLHRCEVLGVHPILPFYSVPYPEKLDDVDEIMALNKIAVEIDEEIDKVAAGKKDKYKLKNYEENIVYFNTVTEQLMLYSGGEETLELRYAVLVRTRFRM